jgi:hypothetical protein
MFTIIIFALYALLLLAIICLPLALGSWLAAALDR